MSDAVLDRGLYFPSPMTDWYRERPFKVAFVASLFMHAVLIALVPGFRAVVIEPPTVLNVEIVLPEQPQARPMPMREVVPQAPVMTPTPPQRSVEQMVARSEPLIEPRPEPVVRQQEIEPPPLARAEIVPPLPRPEPRPEPLVAPRPEPRPEARVEPRAETKPEPRIEPRAEPPPVARVEPRPEPRPLPPVEPRPEPRPEPRTEVRPEPQPVARVDAPPVPVAQPRIEPVTPQVRPPAPPVPTAVQPAPVAVPVPPAPAVVAAPVQPPPAPGISETAAAEQLRRLQESFSAAAARKLRDTLNNAVYPVVTRKRAEWNLVLQVRVSAAGVVDVSVSEGSGERAIDNVVIRNLRSAPQNLRELLPSNLRGHAFSATVPVRIQIQRS